MIIKRIGSFAKRKFIALKNEHLITQCKGLLKNRKKYLGVSKRIYVVSTPEYGNLGDHAIALAQIDLLENTCKDYEIVDIADTEFLENYLCFRYLLKEEDIICLMGGGNFGIVYPEVEFVRRKMIKGCRKNKIIMFPQTLDFGNKYNSLQELKKTIRIYGNHPRLYLMAREERSYTEMKILFKHNNVLLCPDAALTWKYKVVSESQTGTVIVCLRKDSEKQIDNLMIKKIIGYLQVEGYIVENIDTELQRKIDKQSRKKEVEDILKKFVGAKFVITDRLHGMIFSYLCGTPCLAFDNCNKKVSRVAEWITGDLIRVCDDYSRVEKFLQEVSTKSHIYIDNSRLYDLLKREITSIVYNE